MKVVELVIGVSAVTAWVGKSPAPPTYHNWDVLVVPAALSAVTAYLYDPVVVNVCWIWALAFTQNVLYWAREVMFIAPVNPVPALNALVLYTANVWLPEAILAETPPSKTLLGDKLEYLPALNIVEVLGVAYTTDVELTKLEMAWWAEAPTYQSAEFNPPARYPVKVDGEDNVKVWLVKVPALAGAKSKNAADISSIASDTFVAVVNVSKNPVV